MNQHQVLRNEFSIRNRKHEGFLDSETREWQPFSTPNRFQVQKQYITGITPPDQATKSLENIENTDFLSAIPYAKQSKTVKRKLNYEDNRLMKSEETVPTSKTYFPFEFIGHASRQSVAQNSFAVPENERRLHNPTMVTGRALRRTDVNGRVYQTALSSKNEAESRTTKRVKSSSSRSNSMVALEQHFEQIRRKHAEFNWDVPGSQHSIRDDETITTTAEIDNQLVPTTPFIEHHTSPSLYSSNETPFEMSMPWMSTPTLSVQNLQPGRKQRLSTEDYSSSELWSGKRVATQEFQENQSRTTKDHLFPH